MTTFSVTITDPAQLAGISAARAAYNAAQPLDPKTQQPLNQLATDNDYFVFVMTNAAISYAKGFGFIMSAAEQTALQTKLANVITVVASV